MNLYVWMTQEGITFEPMLAFSESRKHQCRVAPASEFFVLCGEYEKPSKVTNYKLKTCLLQWEGEFNRSVAKWQNGGRKWTTKCPWGSSTADACFVHTPGPSVLEAVSWMASVDALYSLRNCILKRCDVLYEVGILAQGGIKSENKYHSSGLWVPLASQHERVCNPSL